MGLTNNQKACSIKDDISGGGAFTHATQHLRVPFNVPWFSGHEATYLAEAFTNKHCASGGPFTEKCEAILSEELGVNRVLLTTSCTHALEIAALLLDLQSGDEVIVPSFTFVSTANAFSLHGAKIVFADIRQDTLNMDESQIEDLITDRTRAIVPVHYAGVGCAMDSILEQANARDIMVVEDNAHGIMGKYNGRHLGSLGSLATLSFHETKNLICGEGGALIVNDERLVERAKVIREKGTNRDKFFQGQVDKYTWVDKGSSYGLSDILAAVLYAQIQNRNRILGERERVWCRYHEELSGWATSNGIRLPVVPLYCQQSYHMFYLLMPTMESRTALIEYLRERNISAVFHYQPLHLSTVGRKFGAKEGQCPVTERVSQTLLRLPFYTAMSEEEQDVVIKSLVEFSA